MGAKFPRSSEAVLALTFNHGEVSEIGVAQQAVLSRIVVP